MTLVGYWYNGGDPLDPANWTPVDYDVPSPEHDSPPDTPDEREVDR